MVEAERPGLLELVGGAAGADGERARPPWRSAAPRWPRPSRRRGSSTVAPGRSPPMVNRASWAVMPASGRRAGVGERHAVGDAQQHPLVRPPPARPGPRRRRWPSPGRPPSSRSPPSPSAGNLAGQLQPGDVLAEAGRRRVEAAPLQQVGPVHARRPGRAPAPRRATASAPRPPASSTTSGPPLPVNRTAFIESSESPAHRSGRWRPRRAPRGWCRRPRAPPWRGPARRGREDSRSGRGGATSSSSSGADARRGRARAARRPARTATASQ